MIFNVPTSWSLHSGRQERHYLIVKEVDTAVVSFEKCHEGNRLQTGALLWWHSSRGQAEQGPRGPWGIVSFGNGWYGGG